MRLRDVEQFRRFHLREASRGDQIIQLHSELHAQLALARVTETKIDENVAAARIDGFAFLHNCFRLCSAKRGDSSAFIRGSILP